MTSSLVPDSRVGVRRLKMGPKVLQVVESEGEFVPNCTVHKTKIVIINRGQFCP